MDGAGPSVGQAAGEGLDLDERAGLAVVDGVAGVVAAVDEVEAAATEVHQKVEEFAERVPAFLWPEHDLGERVGVAQPAGDEGEVVAGGEVFELLDQLAVGVVAMHERGEGVHAEGIGGRCSDLTGSRSISGAGSTVPPRECTS